MNDVVKYEPAPLATVMGVTPKKLMTYAMEIADTLSSVLRDRNMTQRFGGQSEHVKSEGWQLAGSLMGFTVSEGPAVELPDGSYEAIVELRSIATGKTLATASARCGVDEPNWRSKPKYARRSMAYTRAIGRAYAQNFRWLIHLAGYSGTPAEEMEDLEQREPDLLKGVFEPKKESPVEHYDSAKSLHQTRLKAQLKSKGFPDAFFDKVSPHMAGLPMTLTSINVAIEAAKRDEPEGDPSA